MAKEVNRNKLVRDLYFSNFDDHVLNNIPAHEQDQDGNPYLGYVIEKLQQLQSSHPESKFKLVAHYCYDSNIQIKTEQIETDKEYETRIKKEEAIYAREQAKKLERLNVDLAKKEKERNKILEKIKNDPEFRREISNMINDGSEE